MITCKANSIALQIYLWFIIVYFPDIKQWPYCFDVFKFEIVMRFFFLFLSFFFFFFFFFGCGVLKCLYLELLLIFGLISHSSTSIYIYQDRLLHARYQIKGNIAYKLIIITAF